MPLIKFESKREIDRGFPIILNAGSVVYTGLDDSYIVPKESIKLLEVKKIKFEIPGNNGNGNGKYKHAKTGK